MTATFINSFQSEWLKTKRSLAFWMILIGGFFTPAIVIVARLVNYDKLQELYSAEGFWETHWQNSWESMALFFLPVGAILTTGLIAQIEFKNNTWKQLHAMPLSYTTIFFSKLGVILVLMLLFFLLFNIGIFLSGVIPSLLVPGTPFPSRPASMTFFVRENLLFFLDTLPIVTLQFLISLRFRNFLVPIGLGFLFWLGSLGAISWKFGYIIPYTYPMYNFLKGIEKTRAVMPDVNYHALAATVFAIVTAFSFLLYVRKIEKG